MNQKHWQKTIISFCETYHLFDGKPLYTKRFNRVLKYHEPGLAPVIDLEEAFHIDLTGVPAYSKRFIETFGFYENLAAVRNREGWFHIKPSGEQAYSSRYSWCGNFQENYCPVKDNDLYFHINHLGNRAYPEEYHYVGDFKDGIAVVCQNSGLHTHIDYTGKFIHHQWFVDLDIFHKGYARAKNENGWFHIDKFGKAIYPQRYSNIEPFYNGSARVETFDGALLIINTRGEISAKLRPALNTSWQDLSAEMVGFWGTEIIATAARLSLFNCLPGSTSEIAIRTKIPEKHLTRLLRALWELNLITYFKDIWQLTKKGELLAPQDKKFFASAAIMWSDVNSDAWKNLAKLLQIGYRQYHPIFKAKASDETLQLYHQAIDGYAKLDCESAINTIDWTLHKNVLGFGRTAKTWLGSLLLKHTHLQATLMGEAYVLKFSEIDPSLSSRYSVQIQNALEPWIHKADAIMLPKFLHYWPDKDVQLILKQAAEALVPGGAIYIFEMLLNIDDPNGSLLDLNMFVESGGQLRTLSDWEDLFGRSKLKLSRNISISPWLNLLAVQA